MGESRVILLSFLASAAAPAVVGMIIFLLQGFPFPFLNIAFLEALKLATGIFCVSLFTSGLTWIVFRLTLEKSSYLYAALSGLLISFIPYAVFVWFVLQFDSKEKISKIIYDLWAIGMYFPLAGIAGGLAAWSVYRYLSGKKEKIS